LIGTAIENVTLILYGWLYHQTSFHKIIALSQRQDSTTSSKVGYKVNPPQYSQTLLAVHITYGKEMKLYSIERKF